MSSFDYESRIVSIPDYPEPGVIFKDIMPLVGDPVAFKSAVKDIADRFRDAGATKVVGPEARGFIIGSAVAYELGVGFVPARKPGKLPRAVYKQEYSLEYGTDSLEMHKDSLSADDKVLIIDDLVATGGSTEAAAKLCGKSGAQIVGFGFILELEFLKPRDLLAKDFPGVDVFSLVQVKERIHYKEMWNPAGFL